MSQLRFDIFVIPFSFYLPYNTESNVTSSNYSHNPIVSSKFNKKEMKLKSHCQFFLIFYIHY